MPLSIRTKEKKPMFFELALEGRLDMDTYNQMQAAVDIIFDSGVKGISVDLNQLEYINSMGLRVIFSTAKRAKKQNATFVLTRPQPQVKAILDIANALPSQSIFTSIEEADRYFDKIQKQKIDEIEESSSV